MRASPGVFLGVFLGVFGTLSAEPHRLTIHPAPSLAVFSIAQGPQGFLWLAAADGLYRFDGFHFRKITSFPFVSSRYVGFTSDGTLWAGGFEGLARTANHRFETLSSEAVGGMAVFPDEIFARLPAGIARVGLDGSIEPIGVLTRRDLNVDSRGWVSSVCTRPNEVCLIDPTHPRETRRFPLPPGAEFVAVLTTRDGKRWVADDTEAVLFDGERAESSLRRARNGEMRRPAPLFAGRNGQIWFLGETVRGLTTDIRFHDRQDHDRFAPFAGFEDSGNRVWVAAAGEGLVAWTRDPRWERWPPEDFAGEPASLMIRDRIGPVLATHKNLYRPKDGNWVPIAAGQRRYEGLMGLDDGGFLAATRTSGIVRLDSRGEIVERIKDLPGEKYDYRKIVRDAKGRIWVASKRVLLHLDGRPGSFHLRPENLPGADPNWFQEPVDLELDSSGKLWVGYAEGIAWLDDQDVWRRLTTDRPVTMVRSFTRSGDDIWVAHRRSGEFSRLHRTGDAWHVTLFSASAGYGPADTDFVHRDSRGWIWRGSSHGVHISDGTHFAPDDWLHLHLANGLATDETGQYGFFEDTDGSVWIAGDDGVTHLHPDASWFDAPHSAAAPRVTRIEADGQVFLYPDALPQSFPSSTRIVRIEVGSLDAPPFRDRPLRYRLTPGQKDWQLSGDGALEFRDLRAGRYSLELGFAGNGASAIAEFPFRIGAEPLSLWIWMIAPLLALAAAAVRYLPWLERTRFRAEKWTFLLRRRFRASSTSHGAGTAAQDYSGQTFGGRYRLLHMVSRGGFSSVYEASDLEGEHGRVAVKILNPLAGDQGWIRDRFAHEIAALRTVRHPGVVTVLDSWIAPGGEPCIAMPFLEGPTLRAALEDGPFPPRRAAGIVRQLGASLGEVHRRGLVHRDLKPENVILCADDHPVLIDFGTAGVRGVEDELAATTLMAGSFHYMAPERLTGRYSPASDLFSFAVVILEMRAAKRLGDLGAMFSDASFVDELSGVLGSEKLARKLASAFDPDPRGRPGDARTWAAEIAALLDGSA